MRKILAVLAVAAVLLGVGAVIAAASIPSSDGTINGCRKNSNGALIVIDSAASCPSGHTPLNWKQTGASGFVMEQTFFGGLAISAGGTVSRGDNCPGDMVATGGGYHVTTDGLPNSALDVFHTEVFNDPVGTNGGYVITVSSTETTTVDIFIKVACMDAVA